MNEKINDIMNIMESIEYGFPDENGKNLIDDFEYYDNHFNEFYYLRTPKEILKSKIGVCWCQVEVERELFVSNNIKCESYWICTYDGENLPSHTFLVYENDSKFYWFEHSWNKYKGIHEYNSLNELLKDVKRLHLLNHDYVDKNALTLIYRYEKPKINIKCDEFYNYIESQEYIELEPLYFYHLINKDADITKGLLSLQYMYDNKMYDLFDEEASKYIDRITTHWNIEKYKDKTSLSREEIIDALNIYRGNCGSKYIYFFKYPPYNKLGNRMSSILKEKQIIRIDLNNKDLFKEIEDVFYGNNTNREYYENVSIDDYFKDYDDSSNMNFASINHIGISFKDGYIPYNLLERVDNNE